MDIGHPLWFLKPRRKLATVSISSKQLKLANEKRALLHDELELVITNILNKQSKIKNLRKFDAPTQVVNTTVNSEQTTPTHASSIDINLDETNSFIPINPEPRAESMLDVEPISDVEVTVDSDATDVEPLFDVVDKLLPDTTESSDFTDGELSSSTLSSNSVGMMRRSKHRDPATTLENLNKFKTVITRMNRKLKKSLKNEPSHDSRKYKILITIQKLMHFLKYPTALICGGVGLYHMYQPYSELLSLIATNSTSVITSVMFSIVTSIAGRLGT